MHYLVIIEKAQANYSAFVPDMPGCIATGKTVDAAIQNLQEAIQFHIEGLEEEGEAIPMPQSLRTHLEHGTFDAEKIGENYFIGNIGVSTARVAA